ncbi:MAG TPA: chemotaxis protein CheW [Gammaproteobacteria bacterium]
MTDPQEKSPILLLLALEQKAKRAAHGLPQQMNIQSTWDAIGFGLMGRRLVVAMNDVREILTPPPLTRIPGARDWVLGVANVRGNLMPILDLRGFLTNESVGARRRSRVLVISRRGVTAGLMVDEIYGMRHFLDEEFSPQPADDKGTPLGNYLVGSYRQTGEQWGIFDMNKLFETPEFMKVAA